MTNMNNMRAHALAVTCALASMTVAALVGVLTLTVLVGIIISLGIIIIRFRRTGTGWASLFC